METKLNDPYTTDSIQKEEKKTSGTQKRKKFKKILGCVEFMKGYIGLQCSSMVM
jgi:hypothetical protein